MINVIFLNVKENKKPISLTIKNDLETFYKMIDCSAIDIVTRRINGKNYHIICDDEILLKNECPKIGIFAPIGFSIYGNIIIAGFCNEEGDLTSLTEEDVNSILSRQGCIKTIESPEVYFVLKQDYFQW